MGVSTSGRAPRTAVLITAMIVAAGGATAGDAHGQTYTMKLTNVTLNDPNHEFIKEFKKRIEAATDGRIKAQLYPAAQLGGIPRLIEGIQLGTIEWFSSPSGFLKGVDPRFQLIESPGVFESARHAHLTITDPDFREPFLNAAVDKGIKGISVWMYGGSSYASTSPLRTLDDFKGKKFRVLATKLEIALMAELGAAGVPIDYAEVLPALQRRTVDGVRSNIVVMGGSKYYDVTQYVTVVNDTYIPIVAYVSMAFFRKLPAELRDIVEKTARDLEDPMFQVAERFDDRAEKLWRDNGAEVITLSDADQAEFMRRARAVTEKYIAGQPELQDMFKLMIATAEKHKGK